MLDHYDVHFPPLPCGGGGKGGEGTILGYYDDGFFYKDEYLTELIEPKDGQWYFDIFEGEIYYYDGIAYEKPAVGDYLPDVPVDASDNGKVLTVINGEWDKAAAPSISIFKAGDVWNSATLPESTNWSGIAFGGNRYVITSKSLSKKAAYSNDGITWTSAQMNSNGRWVAATYGAGKFVAVSQSSTLAAYSSDGASWTDATLPAGSTWMSVAYGNGKFVAVAIGTASGASSADGATWAAITLPSSSGYRKVCYGGGKFVAILAATGNKCAVSTDGSTWTEITLPSSQKWMSVAYGNGKFIAVAENSNKGAVSTDGSTWTEITLSASRAWQFIAYSAGVFVATSYSDTIAVSADGTTWTEKTLYASGDWVVANNADKLVAVLYDSNKAAYSVSSVMQSGVDISQDLADVLITKMPSADGNNY